MSYFKIKLFGRTYTVFIQWPIDWYRWPSEEHEYGMWTDDAVWADEWFDAKPAPIDVSWRAMHGSYAD